MKTLLKNKFVLVILCLSLLSTIAVGVNIVTVSLQKEGEGDALASTTGGLVDNGVYDIPSNPTKYQKELYTQLSDALVGFEHEAENNDEQEMEICQLLVKNFVADFYTWTNKSSNYNVGGSQFIFSDLYLTFQDQARRSFYNDLDGYIAQYGREKLIEVENVETTIAYAQDYVFNFKGYNAFYVEARWTYAGNDVIDTAKWQNSASFHVIYHPETGKWEIAQFWNLG